MPRKGADKDATPLPSHWHFQLSLTSIWAQFAFENRKFQSGKNRSDGFRKAMQKILNDIGGWSICPSML
jgi:hypothetical protein